jgi:hypothetical protein
LLLAGCFHRTHPAQNQTLALAIAKLPPPSLTPVNLPAATTTIPAEPTENASVPSEPEPKPPAKPKKPVTKPAPDTNTQVAASVSPEVSAMGQLSSGDPDFRSQAEESINATERGLNAINRPLSSSEQVTAEHIREFLKQAKAALASGDVDGARTLAAKAKVLLGELTKP